MKYIVSVLIVVVVIGIVTYLNQPEPTPSNQITTNQNSAQIDSNPNTQYTIQTNTTSTYKYSMSEVSKHNTSTDCWMVINNKVIDITPYIRSHPGGSEILKGCGRDATNLFVREGHSQTAVSIYNQYAIGELE